MKFYKNAISMIGWGKQTKEKVDKMINIQIKKEKQTERRAKPQENKLIFPQNL